LQIARGISTSLADRIIIAKVNNQELWDLNRPLEASVTLSLLDFDSPENNYEARQVFWHSSAHVMGEACERRFDGCCLGYGPPIEEGGFFYDMALGGGKTLSQDDYKQIEDVCKIAVKEKQPFERLELPKEVLLEMFKASGTLCTPSASADCRSTTSTSNTTSTTRSLTGRLPPSTDADLSSISVLVPTCPTPAASSPSP
jgi:hypothetical protein